MADVTVMGAGIFGLSIAWECLKRGTQVQVIDPKGVGTGASGGIVGALAPHVPEKWNDKKAFQFESLIMAEGFWRDVEKVTNLSSGYARLGRLQPISDDAGLALAEVRLKGAQTLWQGKAEWQVTRADDHAFAPETPTGYLIHDTLSARLHPRQACAALVAAIRAQGGTIRERGTPQGQVIWATGVADLERLTAHHTRLVGNGIKGQGALLQYDARNAPQLFTDTLHIIPHGDGTTAIGSTSEREFKDATNTDEQLDSIIARARNAVPALRSAKVIERWAGVRPRTLSRAPMLGIHPLNAGQFIANGGFKIGFGMAPKIAQVMADLLLDGVDTIPDDFRPDVSY